MEWRSRDGVRWLEASLPGAKAVFSTRLGGSLKESRAPLAGALGLDPGRIVFARQVHGTDLVFHQAPPAHDGGEGQRELVEADGHVVTEPGLAALVFAADCLPVAVAGPGGAAMLHCGWRGLAAGIVARGVEAVGATDAVIGPGIGACCYEVGGDVRNAFAALGKGVFEGSSLDLAEAARRLLRAAGVERIESAGLCTRCEEQLFFSHRRDGGPGRQGGIVWLDDPGKEEGRRCPG